LSKKSLILIFLIGTTACSVNRTGKTIMQNNSLLSLDIKTIRKENLSNSDFNIKKAEIILNNEGNKQQFIASIKYKVPDEWLISLRSNSGIEAARALVNSDTVLINDRLHKKLYYGNSKILKEKYGITFRTLPVLFGDVIESDSPINDSIKCKEGKYIKYIWIEKNSIEYLISCDDNKAIKCKISSPDRGEIQLSYARIKVVGNKKFPTKVILQDQEAKSVIEIEIKKIDFIAIEKISFIPGKGYEEIMLK
jgi:hypothetical protein